MPYKPCRDPQAERYRQELAAALGITADELPKVFSGRTSHVLKPGIHKDLLALYPGADVVAVRNALSRYTTTRDYLIKLALHAKHRHDLEARDVEMISKSDKRHAARLLRDLYPSRAKVNPSASPS